jgi:hypothetical protein
MRGRSRAGSLAALLVLAMCASCSRRNLNLGSGSFSLDGGPGSPTDASDAPPSTNDAMAPADGAVIGVRDAAESACVTTAIQLPWATNMVAPLRLEVAATSAVVAVINRQAKQADVRTYQRGGAVISGFQFGADAQFLPYSDRRFLLVARGTTGDFVATAIDPDLHNGTRLFTATANATEHMLGAITLSSTAIVVISDEHFVNVATGTILPWSTVLGAVDADAFKSGRIFGMAAQPDRVLLAWGAGTTLRLAVVDAAGNLLTRADDGAFFGALGSDTATAAPFGDGLLMFDGNPVRITQLGFDLSRNRIGENTQLRTFSASAPQVAAIGLQGRPVAFWLTVFPAADNSQSFATHQLYGCEMDLAAPANCLGTALVATTGLGGAAVSQQPVAAAAFPDGAFAVAHTDAAGDSWLRVANLGCAIRGP